MGGRPHYPWVDAPNSVKWSHGGPAPLPLGGRAEFCQMVTWGAGPTTPGWTRRILSNGHMGGRPYYPWVDAPDSVKWSHGGPALLPLGGRAEFCQMVTWGSGPTTPGWTRRIL